MNLPVPTTLIVRRRVTTYALIRVARDEEGSASDADLAASAFRGVTTDLLRREGEFADDVPFVMIDGVAADGEIVESNVYDASGHREMEEQGRYVVLSTAHVTATDRDILEAASAPLPFLVASYGEGFIISLRPGASAGDLAEIEALVVADGLSAAFLALWRGLRDRGFGMLELDCDGPVSADFPVFE